MIKIYSNKNTDVQGLKNPIKSHLVCKISLTGNLKRHYLHIFEENDIPHILRVKYKKYILKNPRIMKR